MSAKERIGRLQDLLERVQMRAGAPRKKAEAGGNGASHAAHAPHAAQDVQTAAAVPAQMAQIAPPTPPPPPALEPISVAPRTPAMHEVQSQPPAAHADATMEDYDAEVEVSAEVVEVDIDIDEPMPTESGAQPVAHATMPPEDLEEVEEQPMATEPSQRPPAEAQAAADEPAEVDEITQTNQALPPLNEIEEPAPSSSRRPIAAEEVAAEAYEEESSPRHTPPPESGKQVAAPSVHPPSRKPSAPPPASLEGHTLIGGWREPGLGTPQISPTAQQAGIRVPGPSGTEPPATIAQGAPRMSAAPLAADVTKPELAAAGAVATFEGAPIPRPSTLGDLLDLTLGL